MTPHGTYGTFQRRMGALLVACLLLVACVPLAGCSTTTIGEEEPTTPVRQIVPSALAIVHTGAVHGRFEQDDGHIGLAVASQAAHELEDEGFDVLMLDSGDTLGGTELVDLSHGELGVGFMNAAGYDAIAIGGSELSLGMDTLRERMSQSDFAFLSANLVTADDGTPLVDASKAFALEDGRLVGVFALTSPSVASEVSPIIASTVSLSEERLVELAQQEVANLRSQGCRLVICLTDLDGDGAGMSASELASAVSGIDVLLDCDADGFGQSKVQDASGDETLVVGTPPELGAASIVTWERGTLSAQSIEADRHHEADEQVDALVTQAALENQRQLAKALTSATAPIAVDGSRRQETALGDLVADAVLWQAGRGGQGSPDIAIVDGASLRSSLPKGNITRADALAVSPCAETRLCIVRTTGEALLDALAKACAHMPDESDDMPQVAGITITVSQGADDETGPVSISSGGRDALSPTREYAVVLTEQALCRQGAFHALVKKGYTNVTLIDTSVGEALADYLAYECKGSVPQRYASPQRRIRQAAAPDADTSP